MYNTTGFFATVIGITADPILIITAIISAIYIKSYWRMLAIAIVCFFLTNILHQNWNLILPRFIGTTSISYVIVFIKHLINTKNNPASSNENFLSKFNSTLSSLDKRKVCPFCAEKIKAEAIVCKHCGRDLPQDNA